MDRSPACTPACFKSQRRLLWFARASPASPVAGATQFSGARRRLGGNRHSAVLRSHRRCLHSVTSRGHVGCQPCSDRFRDPSRHSRMPAIMQHTLSHTHHCIRIAFRLLCERPTLADGSCRLQPYPQDQRENSTTRDLDQMLLLERSSTSC